MFIIKAGHRIIKKRDKALPSNTISRLDAYQYPIHLCEKGDSDKANYLPRSSRPPKQQHVPSKCTVCGTHFALNDSALDERFWIKSARYLELKEAALSCSWCNILRALVERCTGYSVEVLASAGYVDWGRDPFFPVWYGPDEVVELEIFCTAESERPLWLPSIPIKERAEPDTSNYNSLQMALGWISKCISLHKTCAASLLNTKPPTRLLSLGYPGAEHLKLIETHTLVDWVCLSHRWGEKKPHCLTTSANYATQLQEIPWASLPRTFQQAVVFTRRLGYQYLWIDSLCIIQNDRNDWSRESGRMSDYYGGAAITIAASGAQDCDHGLFNHYHEPPPQFQLPGYQNGLISMRRAMNHKLQADWNNGSGSSELPILSRAWIYQERMLSRRVLHFTTRELQWECREATECQCGRAATDVTNPKIDHVRAFTASDNIYTTFTRYPGLLARWAHVVEEYAQLALTFDGDKLPALSGLAKQFHNSFSEHQYLAGLWYSQDRSLDFHFIRGLLWTKRRKDVLSPRPKQWLAPTWSWISVNGGVSYPWVARLEADESYGIVGRRRKSEIFISVLRAQTNPVNEYDILGEVNAGHMRLRGPIVAGTIKYRSLLSLSRLSNEFDLLTDIGGGYTNSFFTDYAIHDNVNPDNYIANGEKVCILRVCLVGMEPRVLSLVLKKDEHLSSLSNGVGIFRRIGIAEEDIHVGLESRGEMQEIIIL